MISIVQGALRCVTGWIGKFQPNNYQIRTPTATIGVRGTDHETRVIPPDSKEGEAGTYDKVNVGSTLLRTSQGTTEVRPKQAGFAAHFGKQRPALLPAVPGFFRQTKHEGRFVDLHEKVHQRLEQRRNERIEKVKEVRTHLDKAKAEGRFDRRNENTPQREPRMRQNEMRQNPGAVDSPLERRQQFQEQRLQREAGSRRERGEQVQRRAADDVRGDFRGRADGRGGEAGSGHRR